MSDYLLTIGIKLFPVGGFIATVLSTSAVHADGSTILLIIGGVIFAIATWTSRAPGLLRQDKRELEARIEKILEEKELLSGQAKQFEGQIHVKNDQINELKAKDVSALYDLVKDQKEQIYIALQELTAAVTGLRDIVKDDLREGGE